jgi:hypothetical protein
MVRSTQAISRAKRLAASKNSTPIDLAEALWKTERANPGTLGEIISETGLGRRKAYYLMQVWDRFADLEVPRWLLVNVGWTKLALVAKYSEPGAELGWLDLAQRNTAKELEAVMKGGAADRPKAHSVLLRLTPTQYKVFAAVLLKCKRILTARGIRRRWVAEALTTSKA